MFRRKRTATIDGPLTHETLRAWLVAELARRVNMRRIRGRYGQAVRRLWS